MKFSLRTPLIALSMALVLLLPACGMAEMTGIEPAYLSGDRATYDAIAPSYLEYVEGDPELVETAKQRRRTLIESWKIRIEAAEAASAGAVL